MEHRVAAAFQSTGHLSVSGHTASEIDIEFLTFVERYATNLSRWDVLIFFGGNPEARENANGIANAVGRQARPIEKELNDLVYLGVLRSNKNGKGMVYELSDAPTIRRAVVSLAQCCQLAS